MRCYHINNFYLSGIHAGIQSAHAQHELALRYLDPAHAQSTWTNKQVQTDAYLEWARGHKTIVVLNGGMQEQLETWFSVLLLERNPYAWASFHEAKEALNGALTNIALVLPERIYKYARPISDAVAQWSSAQSIKTILKNEDTHIYLEPVVGQEGEWQLQTEMYVDDDTVCNTWSYTAFDINIMTRLSKLGLM